MRVRVKEMRVIYTFFFKFLIEYLIVKKKIIPSNSSCEYYILKNSNVYIYYVLYMLCVLKSVILASVVVSVVYYFSIFVC